MRRLLPPLAMVFAALASAAPAHAVPSFAIQTDQPCSACHVGAFGPRLTQAGRDFKLYGYVANDTRRHSLPISLLASASFTHTNTNQLANEIEGYNRNNNLTLDEVSAFYAGAVWNRIGAFAELSYDAVQESLHWEDLDIRTAREMRLFGSDAVIGVSVNNSPTITDLWDSAPSWSFPYAESGFIPSPAAAPLIDKLGYTVVGMGGYAMLADTLYLETDVYQGLDHSALRALGTPLLNGEDQLSRPALYWRALLQHELDDGRHYLAVGAYGLSAAVYPGSAKDGPADSYSDVAVDATYQWVPHPERSTSDMVSAHALYVHEAGDMMASAAVLGARPSERLSTFRLDATYAIQGAYAATLQRFAIHGSPDAVLWNTASGNPDSAGWVLEFDYVPWGKPDSPLSWLNGRIALQYRAYEKFDGSTVAASDNNTLLLNLTLGAAVNR